MGVFEHKKSLDKIGQKVIIFPILSRSNAPENDYLQLSAQNLEETILPLGRFSRGNDLVAFIASTAGHIFQTKLFFELNFNFRL